MQGLPSYSATHRPSDADSYVHILALPALQRYDVLSTGVGALVVTSWCVYAHGQDPWTALSITATSTVVALVANEVLFNNNKH